jgi:hypothetical protein
VADLRRLERDGLAFAVLLGGVGIERPDLGRGGRLVGLEVVDGDFERVHAHACLARELGVEAEDLPAQCRRPLGGADLQARERIPAPEQQHGGGVAQQCRGVGGPCRHERAPEFGVPEGRRAVGGVAQDGVVHAVGQRAGRKRLGANLNLDARQAQRRIVRHLFETIRPRLRGVDEHVLVGAVLADRRGQVADIHDGGWEHMLSGVALDGGSGDQVRAQRDGRRVGRSARQRSLQVGHGSSP